MTVNEFKTTNVGEFVCIGTNGFETIQRKFTTKIHVTPQWSPFSTWSSCSVTCGIGIQIQSRTCFFNGKKILSSKCEGPERQSKKCNLHKCISPPQWSKFSEWSPCSVSCGSGTQAKFRTCIFNGKLTETSKCKGNNRESRQCFETKCLPRVGGWSKNETENHCCTNDGYGYRIIQRSCNNPTPEVGGKPCEGDSEFYEYCEEKDCKDVKI